MRRRRGWPRKHCGCARGCDPPPPPRARAARRRARCALGGRGAQAVACQNSPVLGRAAPRLGLRRAWPRCAPKQNVRAPSRDPPNLRSWTRASTGRTRLIRSYWNSNSSTSGERPTRCASIEAGACWGAPPRCNTRIQVPAASRVAAAAAGNQPGPVRTAAAVNAALLQQIVAAPLYTNGSLEQRIGHRTASCLTRL
jgi:hypothetical protein